MQLVNHLVLGTYISSGRRAYARDLMSRVTSTQTWGLGDGLPDDVHVELKNGWGPRSATATGSTASATSPAGAAATRCRSCRARTNGYSYGQTTVNRLSRIVFDALDVPLR